jgi:Sulfatase
MPSPCHIGGPTWSPGHPVTRKAPLPESLEMVDRKETRDFPPFTGRGGLFAVAALCISVCSSLASAQENAPCKQIRTACTQAGFKQGAAKDGFGLIVDCMRPILQGVRQRARASKPLPRIDSTLVAACNAANPNFRQREPGPSRSPDGIEAFWKGATGVENEAADAPLRTAGPGPSANAPGTARRRPNFVFILTDDLSWNLVQFMPHVVKMQNEGVTFSRYFVTDSLCCPSRSSILTGRYPHSTGVFKNKGPDGGYSSLSHMATRRPHLRLRFLLLAIARPCSASISMATVQRGTRPPRVGPSGGVAGNGYPEFNYDLNQNGTVVHYDGKPTIT